jgi:hypothetical protein
VKAEIRLGPDPPDRTTGVAPYRIRMDETPRGCSNDANVHSLMRVRSGSGRMSGLRQQRPLAFFTLLPGMCFLDTVLAQSRVKRSAFVPVRTGR